MIFLFFGQFSDRMHEGGSFFMYPILMMLLFCIGAGAYAFLKGDNQSKFQKLISHVSLFTLVWGFLGMMIGLVVAFDAIGPAGSIAPQVLASGIKQGLLSPIFGMVAFLVARVVIIGLTFKK